MDFPRKIHEPINPHEDTIEFQMISMTQNPTRRIFKRTRQTFILFSFTELPLRVLRIA